MIKFFRHIRKRLVAESKISKYLLYAIGEILLVVVGILIALQVSNWNQSRLAQHKEILLLKELHQEFKQNKKQLDTVIFYHERAHKSSEYLLKQCPINLKTVNLDSLGYHTFYMTWTYTYNPSQGITNSLLNSSSFDIISNDTLRKLLISWPDILNDYTEEENQAKDNYINHLKPYEKKHMLYAYDFKKMYSDPRLDLSFLTSHEFDNYVLDRNSDIENIISDGEKDTIIAIVDKIIELSNPALYD